VARGLHEDAALDAEARVQRKQLLLGRIGRRERPPCGEGEHRLRAEDVEMRVARPRRQAHDGGEAVSRRNQPASLAEQLPLQL
jgi:hypothetical protein